MFARVTIVEGQPDGVDKSIRHMRETIIPSARQMKGFKGLYELVDRKTGKTLTIALWDTEADLNASSEAARGLRTQSVKAMDGKLAGVEAYEVAIQP